MVLPWGAHVLIILIFENATVVSMRVRGIYHLRTVCALGLIGLTVQRDSEFLSRCVFHSLIYTFVNTAFFPCIHVYLYSNVPACVWYVGNIYI